MTADDEPGELAQVRSLPPRVLQVDLLAMGRIGMDFYPTSGGPLGSVTEFRRSLGGTAANVAVAAARLGHHAALLSKVGDDQLGRVARQQLLTLGVDATWLGVDASLLTPLVIAELDPPSEPTIHFYRAPSAPDLQLEGDDLDVDAVRTARVLWVTGTGLSEEPSRSTTLAAMGLRDRTDEHQHTVLDLDWRPTLWDADADVQRWYADAVGRASVVVGNRAEVAVALDLDAPDAISPHEAASRLLELGPRLVAVKLGADGLLLADRQGRRVQAPPVQVDVVCGLGAGDAFGGALVHGLLTNMPLEQLARTCSAAGAYVAAQLACADAMPTREVLEEFMREHDTRGDERDASDDRDRHDGSAPSTPTAEAADD